METNRYYIEVAGVKEKEQLLRLGIRPEHIIEVSASAMPTSVGKIASAISQVLGVTLSTIQGTSRKRTACLARLIFVHNAIKEGVVSEALTDFLSRKNVTIQWYEKRYRDAIRFDKEMRTLDARVNQIINQ